MSDHANSSSGMPRATPSATARYGWAWVPIPVLLLAILALWVADVRTEVDSPVLVTLLNSLTRTLASVLIVYLAGRCFLVRRTPGLLLLGCGVAVWGASGFITTSLLSREVNLGVTISNLGLWLAALCHLAGAMVARGADRPLRAAGVWLAAGYVLALGAVGLIALATFAGWLPTFFVDGQGGTLVRHLVLGSALAIFVLTALLLWRDNRDFGSSFAPWYACALLLIAVGVFGMLVQTSRGSVLNWACRTAQYLGGIYMLVAALAARRESGGWTISLAAVEEAWRGGELLLAIRRQPGLWWVLRYGLALGAVAGGFGLHRMLTAWVGPGLPTFILFYPAVIIVALFAGFGPGLLATALTAIVVNVWTMPPGGQWSIRSPADRLALVIFAFNGLLICAVTELYRRNRERAAAYERETALRESREALRRQAELIDPVRAELIAQEMQRAVRERGVSRERPKPAATVAGAAALTTWAVRIAGAAAILVGGYWLAAWLGGYAVTWSATSSVITVKTNMALCQLLAGVALLLLEPGSRRCEEAEVLRLGPASASSRRRLQSRQVAGTVLALMVLAVAALTLSEHLFALNLGIDQLLAREAPGAAATLSPNRMGYPGSLGLTLLGVGLLALASKRRALAPYLGLAVCLIILVPAVGFLYDISRFYTQPLTGIAWPTVMVLSALGLGLVLAVRETGPMVLLLREDAGGTLLRRILPAVILVPLALGFLRVHGQFRGLYDTATGTGLLVIAMILIFAVFLWRSAARLSHAAAVERASEEALHNQAEVMDQASEALIVREMDGIIRSWNRGAEKLYGWSAAEAVGQSTHTLLGTPSGAVQEFEHALEQGGQWEGELLQTTRDGRRLTIESRKTASPTKDGHVLVLESNRDATARKQAEEALRASEERLRKANTELQQRIMREQAANAALREARRAALNLMKDAVASRQRAEQAGAELQRKEADLSEAQRVAQIGSWHWDAKTDVSTGSDELLRIYGLDPATETMPNFKAQWGRCYPVEDWERINSAAQRALQTGAGYELDVRVLRNGATVWATARGEVVRDAQGQIVGLRGTVQDITERKQAEEAVRESEEKFSILFSKAAIPAALSSLPDGAFVDVNDAWTQMTGYTKAEVIGKTAVELGIVDDAELRTRVIEQLRKHEPVLNVERTVYPKSGVPITVLVNTGCIEISGKNYALSSAYDITDRKKAQEVLARSKEELEKLVAERTERLQEMVGELEHFSYTITHDMRAPLRGMRGFGELLLDWCAGCEHQQRREFIGRIMMSAGRMDALITDALDYSRSVRQELPLENVDTGALLRGMLDTYPELQASRAHIRVEGNLPVVLGNQAGLTQCFSNLLGNALKFVKPGETPEIRVWAETLQSQPPVSTQPATHNTPHDPDSALRTPHSALVRLWVEDKGIGISKEMLPRVFDMFSRGSHSHEGTGIGLALVRKVAQRMGGRAGVESEEEKGSRFWLELRGAEVERLKAEG